MADGEFVMEYFAVHDFEKHQHYKHRSPPWIKLHVDLLRNYKFNKLTSDEKIQLIKIWLLASQLDNKIPLDREYVEGEIKENNCDLIKFIRLKLLVKLPGKRGKKPYKYLETNENDASTTLASCKQTADTEKRQSRDREETPIVPFESFWEVCPRKVGKGAAEKAWVKALKVADGQTIIRAMIAHAKHWKSIGTEHQFIPHPGTWLNRRSWEDVLPAGKTMNWPTDGYASILS